jgi:predicted aconitase
MKLTVEEEGILAGRQGSAKKKAMELLVKIGALYGAERMIPISRGHVLTSLINFHDAGIQVVEGFSMAGGKYSVPTTIDPVSMSFEGTDFELPEDLVTKQRRIMKAHQEMDVIPTWTCTPYLYENVPRFGEHIAWAESSAVIFANSVLGARTNRMSTGLDAAAALTGMIPEFGLHLTVNRLPSAVVDVRSETLTDFDFHTLGLLLGKLTRGKIPFIKGLPEQTTPDQLKNLGSGLAMTGGLALFHAQNITPEVKHHLLRFDERKIPTQHDILRSDLEKMEGELTTSHGEVDLVTLGCPLYSIEEMKFVAEKVQGRKISLKVPLWIYTSPYVKWMSGHLGYLSVLQESGVKVLSGTCAIVSFLKLSGVRNMMLDSARAAHVIPSEHGIGIVYASPEECIETAIRGKRGI